jgi:hypothetical protein
VTAIVSFARARAAFTGRAQPVATVRHVHLSPRPLVFVPLALAGEANAPLAALVGTHPDDDRLLLVPQPRNRDQRFAFAAELADVVLPYVHSYCYDVEHVRGKDRFTGAPQVLVPNPAGVRFVGLLGRSTRFRRTDGRYPVAPNVPVLGRWFTFLAERAETPGAALLLALTDALALHWASGQSALEDQNLAALLAWISPPPHATGAEAARVAEDPAVCPPAGPATDPLFDTRVLAPAIRAYDGTEPGSPARDRALAALTHALRGQLEPTWRLMWRAVDRLRALPAGASVAERWAADRAAFTAFREHVQGGGPPQGRRDGAVASARRLNRLERQLADYEAARAFDDPLVLAAHRVGGAAFAGTVVAVDRDRRRANANGTPVTRPLVTVRTPDPVRLTAGTEVVAVSRRNQTGTVQAVEPGPDTVDVTLELRGGMGRARVPPPGSLPDVGDELCYTSVLAANVPTPPLPDADRTPWTHGGPPAPYQPGSGEDGEDGEDWG